MPEIAAIDGILLTGFEPFIVRGQRVENPTIAMVDELSAYATSHAILPVEYERTARDFAQLLSARKPRYWIGLGLAAERTEIALEAIALNVRSAPGVDNAGARRTGEPIVGEGPLAYRTSVDVERVAAEAQASGLPVTTSYHAGTFLCNQVFYQAAHHAATEAPWLQRTLFVHIPPFDVIEPQMTAAALRFLLPAICK